MAVFFLAAATMLGGQSSTAPVLLEPAPLKLPLKIPPPKQPTLAQPAQHQPALSSQPSASRGALAQASPASPALAESSRQAAALAKPVTPDASLSRPRVIDPTGTPAATPDPAASYPPPPPLSLPSVRRSSAPDAAAAPPPLEDAMPEVPASSPVARGKRLRFHQEAIASVSEQATHAVKVVIETIAVMRPVSIAITCNEDVEIGRLIADRRVVVRGLRDARLYENKRVYWLVFEDPAFEPDKPISVMLMGNRPLRVTAVNVGPPVR